MQGLEACGPRTLSAPGLWPDTSASNPPIESGVFPPYNHSYEAAKRTFCEQGGPVVLLGEGAVRIIPVQHTT